MRQLKIFMNMSISKS